MGDRNNSGRDNADEKFLISGTDVFYFNFWFGVVATDCVAGLSFLTNLVNMRLFLKQGLKERVNFTLFCLSICDFNGALFITAVTRALTGDVWILDNLVEWSSFYFTVGWGRNIFTDLSTALTVFISIERCTCVILPFSFNTSFIARRAKSIILCIFVFVLVIYFPSLATIRFAPLKSDKNAATVYVLEYSDAYLKLQKFNDFLLGFILAIACQICIFVCAVLMYRGFKKTSAVRSSTLADLGPGKTMTCKSYSLSSKETRVVKMILVLAIFYMASAMPQVVYCWMRVLFSDFVIDEPAISLVMVNLLLFSGATYGAFSAFIYYNFSSNYRLALYQCLRISPAIVMKTKV